MIHPTIRKNLWNGRVSLKKLENSSFMLQQRTLDTQGDARFLERYDPVRVVFQSAIYGALSNGMRPFEDKKREGARTNPPEPSRSPIRRVALRWAIEVIVLVADINDELIHYFLPGVV